MRIFSSRKRMVKVLVSGIALALIPASMALANWGPSRPTFTWAHPATYVTFDSITDNPTVGDERPFFSGKVTSAPGNVVDNIHVNDNDEVTLRVFYHNDAATNLNLVATNTRVKVYLPTVAATSTFATSTISADNANPKVVSDTVDFNGDRPFTLQYEPGSAQITSNGSVNGDTLSDSIVTNTGALIGYNALDGNIPGCSQYSGFVTIKVRVHMQPPAPQPVYSCNLLSVTHESDRTYSYSVDATAQNGATITGYTFDFGDSSSVNTTGNTTSHTYAKDGTYTSTATVKFNVGDSQKTASCSHEITVSTPPVTPPSTPPTTPTPTSLPQTGPGDVLGIFTGVSSLGAVGHYVVNRRRR